MSRSFNGSSQYLSDGSLSITFPLTISAWIYPGTGTTGAGEHGIVVLTNHGSDATSIALWVAYNGGATNSLAAKAQSAGGGTDNAFATTQLTPNVWTHGCAIFNSTSSRACYQDGANKGTNATLLNSGTLSFIDIGAENNTGSFLNLYSGLVADVCLWNVALTDDEVAVLAKGVPAYLIRPTAIVRYYPVYGLASPEPDFSGNAGNMTLVASPTIGATNPPITLFTGKTTFQPLALPTVVTAVPAAHIIGANFRRKIRYVGY